MIGFSVTHNTPSDYVKAAFAGATVILGSLIVAAPDGFTSAELLSAALAGTLALGSALGFYSAPPKNEDV